MQACSKYHDISQQPHSKIYCTLEQEYNRIEQRCKREYNNNIRLKLQNLNSDNPNEYWKFWKHLNPRPVNNSTLLIDQFDSYYKDQVKPPYTNYFDEIHMEEIKNHVDAYFESCENNQYSAIDSLTNDIYIYITLLSPWVRLKLISVS